MMLNAAPLNAAPINGVAFTGAITYVGVDAQGVGRASTDSTTAIIAVDPMGQVDVKMVGSRTAGVHVNPFGSGATNNVWAGTTAINEVTVEGAGTHLEKVQGFGQTNIEILSFAHYGQLYGGRTQIVEAIDLGHGTPIGYETTTVEVGETGAGRPIAGSSTVIEVLVSSTEFMTAPATAGVAVNPFGAINIRQGGGAAIEAQALTGGNPTGGAVPIVETQAQAGNQIGEGSLTEIEVQPLAFMSLRFGGTVEVPIRAENVPNVRVTGDFSSVVTVTPEHPNNLLAWSLANVETLAQGVGNVPDGRLSTLEVSAEALLSVRDINPSLAVNEVSLLSGGLPSGGGLTEVLVDSESGGMILSRAFAPDFRTIYRGPRRKSIVFTGDDRSLKMAGEFEKQPREVVDYDIDLTEFFAAGRGDDYITQIQDVLIEPEGLVLGSPHTPNVVLQGTPAKRFKIWLSGGVDGGEYKVTALVKTNIGRVEEIDFTVRVEEQ